MEQRQTKRNNVYLIHYNTAWNETKNSIGSEWT